MNYQRDERDNTTMHYPQSTNNRYIYDTINPLIHYRPHSASVVSTYRFKQDLYMHKARMRKQSFVQEKNIYENKQLLTDRKIMQSKPITQYDNSNNKNNLKIQSQNNNNNNQKQNLFKKHPSLCYKEANDFFLYLKASCSKKKNNQSCFIDSNDNNINNNNLYDISPIKENILLPPSQKRLSKGSILKPINLIDIALPQNNKNNNNKQYQQDQQKQNLQNDNKNIMNNQQLYNSPKIKRKSSHIHYASDPNLSSPLKSGKISSLQQQQSSPIKRERQYQNEFEIFQKQTFFEKLRLKFGESQILSMRYSPDDKYLAFSQSNGKTTIFSDAKGIALQNIRDEYACNSVRWNPMEQRSCLLEGYANGAIHYRQIKSNLTNSIIQTFEIGQNYDNQQYYSSQIQSDSNFNQFNSSNNDNTDINVNNINTNNNSINCLEFLPSGLTFLSGCSDSTVRQYDVITGQKINTMRYHKNRVFAIKSIDEKCYLSAGWDHTVFLYDLRSNKVQKYIYGPMIFGDSLDFRNYQVLCGSWREDKQLEIYDLRNDSCEQIKWENISKNDIANFVYCCQFSKVNDKHIVAGSTGKYELRVFDRNDNNICVDAIDKTLTKGVFSLDFRNHSNHLSFGTSDANYGLVEII